MIRTFKCKETEKLFDREKSIKLPNNIQKKARIKLETINAATDINDLRIPPSNHLETLKGNLKGKHSIRINKQWRIVFKWNQGHAYEVQITDYH